MKRLASSTCPDCREYGEFEFGNGPADNVIRSPGKFEAECDFAVHFYHAMMDGFGELCACGAEVFSISEVDAEDFPSLTANVDQVAHLGISDNGFICCEILTAAEHAAHESEAGESQEEEAE